MRPACAQERRRGFALLTALWVLAGTATVAAALSIEARSGSDGARNLVFGEQSYWRAFGCAESVRHAADMALQHAPDDVARRLAWLQLDGRVTQWWSPTSSDCRVEMEPSGTRLDIQALDEASVRGLLASAGFAGSVDLLVDALFDWTDVDDDARPSGAERGWYESQFRAPPRNGPLADVRELRLVRGFEAVFGAISPVLSTQPGPVCLNHASRVVLLTLPAFSPEVVQRVLDRRSTGEPLMELRNLVDGLSPAATAEVLGQFAELAERTVVEPTSWVISVEAAVGDPAVSSRMEVTVARGGVGVAVVGRRTW